MFGRVRNIAVATAAISLGIASSVAVPAPIAPAATPVSEARAPAGQINPWLTLSAMTASTSSVSAIGAAQGEAAAVGWPNIAPLSVVLGSIATSIYILLDEDKDNGNGSAMVQGLGLRPTPLSPA